MSYVDSVEIFLYAPCFTSETGETLHVVPIKVHTPCEVIICHLPLEAQHQVDSFVWEICISMGSDYKDHCPFACGSV
jgi:hypothetical protein